MEIRSSLSRLSSARFTIVRALASVSLGDLANAVTHRHRKSWQAGELTYLQLRDLKAPELASLQGLVDQYTEACDAIVWAKVNAELNVLVVHHQAGLPLTRCEDMLCWAEQQMGVVEQPFAKHCRFPADHDRYYRTLLEMAADITGLGVGVALRFVPGRRAGLGLDVSALATALENIPNLREPLEQQIGADNTELALNVISSFGEAIMSGWSGSITDLAHRYHRLQEYCARCESWQRWQPLLANQPEFHPLEITAAQPRPNPLPKGPVERYSRSASQMALGGFGFGVAATHSLEQAAASVFSGVPKPARLGLSSFVQHTSLMLSNNGLLVLNPDVLECLDRLTAVVIDFELVSAEFGMITEVQLLAAVDESEIQQHLDSLFNYQYPLKTHHRKNMMLAPLSLTEMSHLTDVALHAELDEKHFFLLGLWRDETLLALVYVQRVPDSAAQLVANRIRQSGLKLYVVDHSDTKVAWLHPDGLIQREQLQQEIIELQKEDEIILYISCTGHPALVTADIGMALWEAGAKPPWHTDVLSSNTLQQVWLLLEAAEIGKRNSEQAVELSKIEAVAGLVLSIRQLDELSIRRIKLAANATAFAAMLNAVRNVRSIQPCPHHIQNDVTPWHALSIEHVLKRLQSDAQGLTQDIALQRLPKLEKHVESDAVKLLQNWGDELFSPLTPMLAAGAALSALTGSLVDAALISGVVVVNALIGGVQRYQVEAALAQLDQQEHNKTYVLRDGDIRFINSDELVAGDVISLRAGELVPADCRIIEAEHLEVDESSLTGESLPVKKKAKPTYSPIVAERTSMLYEATTVVQGQCHGVVVATGDATESRRSHTIQMQDQQATGVEARLESITASTLPISALSGALLLVAGLARNQPTDQLISTGVSLAVAAVPEGLPILSTMAQLASAQRLSQKGALVRNPRSIEALGRIDVLCADKTGTLTEGKLTLVQVSNGFRSECVEAITQQHDEELHGVLIACLRGSPNGFSGKALPHVTDQALFDGAKKADITGLSDLGSWHRVYEKMFKSERGFHAVLGTTQQGGAIYLKGAPDKLIPLCAEYWLNGECVVLDDAIRQQLEDKARQLADAGLRVLCVAHKTVNPELTRFENADVTRLTFRGFVALADPVRPTAKQSVQSLAMAGVEVMMITGDHPVTARSIAHQLALKFPDGIITGAQLDQLDEDELAAALQNTSVFARVTPSQKARIVKALQNLGRTVAMTGDGANDAAAIRLAEVGIALGEKSTPAARAAADLLVANEQIETIVLAVLEGRALWGSVKDAVSLLVGGNLGEIGFTLLGGLLDGRSPLNARQLLLVNMLTDSLPALAVALRRPKHLDPEQLLKEGPEHSLGDALSEDIAWRALTTGGSAAIAWGLGRLWGPPERASTIAMLALVGGQLGQTLSKGQRSPTVLATSIGSLAALVAIVQTPGVSHFFGCRPLGPVGLGQAAFASVLSSVGTQVLPRISKKIRHTLNSDFQLTLPGKNRLSHSAVAGFSNNKAAPKPPPAQVATTA